MALRKSLRRHLGGRRSSRVGLRKYLLTTLGAASLSRTTRGRPPVLVLGPGKLASLLVYLTCATARRARTDELVELLWSDRDPTTGHHDLRQAIWQLRRHLGRSAIACKRGEVVLRARLAVDRDDFLAAVEQGSLERAVDFYAGDFLAGFAPVESAGFEQWMQFEGYRLRRTFTRAAESLTRRWLAAKRFGEAQRLARRVRDADPHEEGAWVLLLETLLAAGEPVRAAAEADLFERVLHAEGRTPEPGTLAMLRRVRRAAEYGSRGGAPAPLAPALAGREREINVLLRAWERARGGTGRHVHVVAGTGLGKTRLLHEFRARLRAAGAQVLYVAARFPARRVVFGFASELAAALAELPGAVAMSPPAAAALVALNPSLSARFAVHPHPARDEDAPRRRALALLELVGSVTEEQPLAVLCDDLQWADAASADLLSWLFAQLTGVRALCVTAATPAPPGGRASPTTERIELRPLTAEMVRALLASLASLPDAPWAAALVAQLHEASGGSPRVVLERLEHALERGWLRLRPSGWTCADRKTLSRELAVAGTPEPVPIVVLPFVVERPAEADHLGEGLTEGLISDLSRIAGLRVVAHASAMRLKGSVDDPRAAARAVGARYLLQGRMGATRDRLEVAARLWDASTGAAVREEVVSGAAGDLPALHARLTQAVVEGLALRLSPSEERGLRPCPVGDMHAYECFLRARQCIVRFTPEELERGLQILRYGLELAGENALLYAAMGMVYWNLVHSGANPDGTLVQRAEEYAARAFALDPDLPQGYVLGGLIARMQGRVRDAVGHFRRALALDPNSPDALFWLGVMYAIAGRSFAGQALADRLLELDPLTAMNHSLPAFIAMTDGRVGEALAAHRRACELDPNPTARVVNAIALARAQQVDRAHAEFDRLVGEVPEAFAARLGAFLQHALRGDRLNAIAVGTSAVEPVAHWVEYLAWHTAAGYALVGESGRALGWLDRAANLGFIHYPFLMADPLLERIRGEPGFTQLAERVKQAWAAFEV